MSGNLAKKGAGAGKLLHYKGPGLRGFVEMMSESGHTRIRCSESSDLAMKGGDGAGEESQHGGCEQSRSAFDDEQGAGGPHESVVELRAAEGEEDGQKIGGEGAQLAPVVC